MPKQSLTEAFLTVIIEEVKGEKEARGLTDEQFADMVANLFVAFLARMATQRPDIAFLVLPVIAAEVMAGDLDS